MKKNLFPRIIFIAGILSFIIGTLDPMEGSILIAFGSVLIASIAFHNKSKFNTTLIISSTFITIGVIFLWLVSSMGGYDPIREWWWNVLIILYPIGWLITVIILIIKLFKKKPKK